MQRAHNKQNPQAPNTLAEMGAAIDLWKDKFGLLGDKVFYLGKFGDEDDECLVAVNPIGHHQDFQNTNWHMDGTFKCRPKSPEFAQLYVIMATSHGRAFPIVWALMKTRSSKAYDVLLGEVKNHFPNMRPKVIISDYEKAIKKPLRDRFPESEHRGCWFHFTQAIERNARKIGIRKPPMNEDDDGWRVAKQLMATALLPAGKVEEAVGVIEGFAENYIDSAKPKKLIEYFKREWLVRVTPESFSVHGQANRTNNAQESLNRCINRAIRPQGSAWDFWSGLMQITTKEMNFFNQLSEGREFARKKKSGCYKTATSSTCKPNSATVLSPLPNFSRLPVLGLVILPLCRGRMMWNLHQFKRMYSKLFILLSKLF
ncbi:uncharacterized protein LOC111044905 isoform X2 [Nilaparvata lugens]|nr:uncharacterized protein LOC111044905 isoform X2 [Nilaparvata lugens]